MKTECWLCKGKGILRKTLENKTLSMSDPSGCSKARPVSVPFEAVKIRTCPRCKGKGDK